MFKENAGGAGGFKEKKENETEREVKERLERLFKLMEEIFNGFAKIPKEIGDEELYLNIDKMFTQGRVEKLFVEVNEISELACSCKRRDIYNMLASLNSALRNANNLYKEGYLNKLDRSERSNELFSIMYGIQALVGAKEYFTKEKEGGE